MYTGFNNTLRIFVIGYLFLIIPLCVCAQDSKTLENKRKNLQLEINIINRTLAKTLKKKEHSSKSLAILKMQLSAREKLIKTINEELHLLHDDIKQKTLENDSLKSQLKVMKETYSKTIQQAQYSKNILNKLAFVFSAKDFNQSFKRLKYFSQLASYRREQANAIVNKNKKLENNLAQMAKYIRNKNDLLKSKIKEKQNLGINLQQQNKIIKQLQSQEAKLRKELVKKEKEQRSLNTAIHLAIKREMDLAKRKKAQIIKKAKAVAKNLSDSNIEALKLSDKFLENKGKLPWPVLSGHIVEQFGTHPHPSLRKVKTNNIGVNIQTVAGSNIRSVFNGNVIAVQLLYGHYAVIIQHGSYFTTYANLISINVKRGDKVKTRQIIGKAPIDDQGIAEVKFIVTHGNKNIDPELWLASK